MTSAALHLADGGERRPGHASRQVRETLRKNWVCRVLPACRLGARFTQRRGLGIDNRRSLHQAEEVFRTHSPPTNVSHTSARRWAARSEHALDTDSVSAIGVRSKDRVDVKRSNAIARPLGYIGPYRAEEVVAGLRISGWEAVTDDHDGVCFLDLLPRVGPQRAERRTLLRVPPTFVRNCATRMWGDLHG